MVEAQGDDFEPRESAKAESFDMEFSVPGVFEVKPDNQTEAQD